MKKSLFVCTIIVLVTVLIQQCSEINLIPTLVSEENKYKFLIDTVESTNFGLKKVSDHHTFITFDTLNHYFLLDARYSKKKIDLQGNVLANIRHSQCEIPYKSHYGFTDSTVYDFSETEVSPVRYQRIVNHMGGKVNKNWMNVFDRYYRYSGVVIYGRGKVYLKGKDGWTLVIVPSDLNIKSIDSEGFKELTLDGYPPKYAKLIFLKDGVSGKYSDYNSKYGRDVKYEEELFNYPVHSFKKIGYEKKFIQSYTTYTPFPIEFNGIGYYKTRIYSDTFFFKVRASKMPFKFFKSEVDLAYYSLPNKYQLFTEVSFINYSFPRIANDNDSQGLYIIKRKNPSKPYNAFK